MNLSCGDLHLVDQPRAAHVNSIDSKKNGRYF